MSGPVESFWQKTLGKKGLRKTQKKKERRRGSSHYPVGRGRENGQRPRDFAQPQPAVSKRGRPTNAGKPRRAEKDFTSANLEPPPALVDKEKKKKVSRCILKSKKKEKRTKTKGRKRRVSGLFPKLETKSKHKKGCGKNRVRAPELRERPLKKKTKGRPAKNRPRENLPAKVFVF